MMTNEPLNVDDEDLRDGMPRIGRPLCQPTSMSYSLLRLRLATILRHIVDRTPVLAIYGGQPNYDVVMDIDTELKMLLNEAPQYFFMSQPDIVKTYVVSRAKANQICLQGLFFTSILYGSRCKLHLPFFSRGFKDPNYAASRDICIESAQEIIRTETNGNAKGFRNATTGHGLGSPVRLNPMGLIKSVFMACIVLLMDMCQSKTCPQKYKQSKQYPDLIAAFCLLKNARTESELASQFLDSMIQILHKHGLSIPRHYYTQDSIPNNAASQTVPSAVMMGNNPSGDYCPYNVADAPANTAMLGNGYLNASFAPQGVPPQYDDLAMTFVPNLELGSIDWDDIITGLDTFP